VADDDSRVLRSIAIKSQYAIPKSASEQEDRAVSKPRSAARGASGWRVDCPNGGQCAIAPHARHALSAAAQAHTHMEHNVHLLRMGPLIVLVLREPVAVDVDCIAGCRVDDDEGWLLSIGASPSSA
jgi:hypothetical protein